MKGNLSLASMIERKGREGGAHHRTAGYQTFLQTDIVKAWRRGLQLEGMCEIVKLTFIVFRWAACERRQVTK